MGLTYDKEILSLLVSTKGKEIGVLVAGVAGGDLTEAGLLCLWGTRMPSVRGICTSKHQAWCL